MVQVLGIFALLGLGLAASASNDDHYGATTPEHPDADAIRYLLLAPTLRPGAQYPSESLFISIDSTGTFGNKGGSDPSPALMRRLQRINPGVKPISARGTCCGTIKSVGTIHFSGPDQASARTGYFCGTLCGGNWEVYLEKIGGHWRVTGQGAGIMS